MHTSKLVLEMFLAAAVWAIITQAPNFFSIEPGQRTAWRWAAVVSGISAVILSTASAYMAAVDWATLPKSPAGLSPGQLWNDGGLPAIVQQPTN